MEDSRDELIAKAAEFAEGRKGSGPPGIDAGGLVTRYYAHVAPEDVVDRSEVDLYGAVASHLKLAATRPQGTANLNVFTPTVPAHGWAATGHTVVEVVTDDMPFLVDSLTMRLNADDHDVHVVIHPQLLVRRDVTGRLLGVLDADGADSGAREESEDGHVEVFHESWMHIEIDRETEDTDIDAIVASLRKVLTDVRESVEDWERMRAQARAIVDDLEKDPPPLDAEEVAEARALLEWLADDHFTFLGYREYRLSGENGDTLVGVPGTGYGILRADPDLTEGTGRLPEAVRAKARERTLLVLTKANSRATVHRPVHLDYVGVKVFDADGEIVGEKRFLGLLSSAAYTESMTRIPVIRTKARAVIEQAGYDPRSHAGKALKDVLENYPRDELFQTPVAELGPIAEAVMHARTRRQLRLFVRRDAYGRFLSCLVYLPRDRYNTVVRERIATILKQRLGGEQVEFTASVGESFLARLHFVVRPPLGESCAEFDVADLERRLSEAARSWRDDLHNAIVAEYGEERGSQLGRTYSDAFPEAYKEDFGPRAGAVDLGRLEAIDGDEGVRLALYEPLDAEPGEARLKIYRVGPPLSLSEVLPVLSTMGVEVVDERPYELENLDRPSYVYDFGLRHDAQVDEHTRGLVEDTIMAVWGGRNESDGFNALVLSAGVTWRQATLLRAYAKYMRQGGTPFAQDYIEGALRTNHDITRLLVRLFETRFDPDAHGADEAGRTARDAAEQKLVDRITKALDDVSSLDQDRILRSYLTAVRATLRTNYFQPDTDGEPKAYLSLKLDPSAIPDLPEPRPRYEIFVYSPRVEGVHLRFGPVARGGLRWSDRRDDFRTEVLGLVKAQMVKNTVIVPVGAKGGFFCKQLPDTGRRDAWLAEGKACYRTFISGLLDVTDNLVGGEAVPPERVVRHDGDDAYLVVAADKGTATFSDLANEVSAEYGFWLGDAFASGGSVGYDHKAMGITARGAWVSVQRHFREMGVDCQSEDFTCVGIGDMSGDVFGNGMLCSEHTRLVAAFDHRDIFLDPDPDPAVSFAERQRLFWLSRSSWADYDTDLISAGGGVYSRQRKSVPISAEVRSALGLADDVEKLTPPELMRAILAAPVDLVWNGGIGTYVKAHGESHAEVGDKANDAIRVDGRDLRCRCVGEGGNLGLTQAGRIEYAEAGGRINTDFIDNSAGVDTSDHEVNIKILLDQVVADGDLTGKQRNELLATMTDEVAALVLADNYQQNLALANSMAQASALLHVHEDWMKRLERSGRLDRALEGLPDSSAVAERLDAGGGLTSPEMAVLLAYTKIVLAEELLDSDLPDDPFLRDRLYGYFPSQMRQGYRKQMESHQLRREIVVTQAVNHLVNAAGITFFHRLSGETSASAAELARACFVAREIFGARSFWNDVADLDTTLDAATQTRMRLEMRTLVERATRWLVSTRRWGGSTEELVDFYGDDVQRLVEEVPGLLSGREQAAFQRRRDHLTGHGVPEGLATRVAVLPPAYQALGVVETARRDETDVMEVAHVHFALGERLGLPLLVERILGLPREDRWQTMARAALRDDLHLVHQQLTARVLSVTSSEDSAPARTHEWEKRDETAVSRASATLEEICDDEDADLARLSVGLRVVRSLLPS